MKSVEIAKEAFLPVVLEKMVSIPKKSIIASLRYYSKTRTIIQTLKFSNTFSFLRKTLTLLPHNIISSI